MADRSPTEVWIDRVSSGHCYIRLGNEKNLATVLFAAESEEAEAVRAAFERLFASRANDGYKPISTQDNKGVAE